MKKLTNILIKRAKSFGITENDLRVKEYTYGPGVYFTIHNITANGIIVAKSTECNSSYEFSVVDFPTFKVLEK